MRGGVYCECECKREGWMLGCLVSNALLVLLVVMMMMMMIVLNNEQEGRMLLPLLG